jgi:hypothetical protein
MIVHSTVGASGGVHPESTMCQMSIDFRKKSHSHFPIAIISTIKNRDKIKIQRHGKSHGKHSGNKSKTSEPAPIPIEK